MSACSNVDCLYCRGAPASTSTGRDPCPRRVICVERGSAILWACEGGTKVPPKEFDYARKYTLVLLGSYNAAKRFG